MTCVAMNRVGAMYLECVVEGKSLKYSKSLFVRDSIEVQSYFMNCNRQAIRKGMSLNDLA